MPEHIDLNTDISDLSIDTVVYTPVRLYNAFAVDDAIHGLLAVERGRTPLSPEAKAILLPKGDWKQLIEAVNLDGMGIEA
jgi:hypothetical protein